MRFPELFQMMKRFLAVFLGTRSDDNVESAESELACGFEADAAFAPVIKTVFISCCCEVFRAGRWRGGGGRFGAAM
jgi:hypothetical protein